MISQAVSDQFELIKVRKDHGLGGGESEFKQTFGDGDNLMENEESKLGTEQRLLRQ